MTTEHVTPGLDRIQQELARGDMAALRAALLQLDERDEQLLAQELGPQLLDRARRRARRARKGAKRGRVVVVHGIMGSMLDVVDAKGDSDRVWLNALRLIAGRFADLELDADEQSAKPGCQVIPAGLMRKAYLPLLLDLDEQWEVRPFAYDWREDIARSADRLADEIVRFASGAPVHVVAHSMGGLVARCMQRRHPAVWSAMQDASGAGAGGRLVMLGTPNLGSYSIPLALSGQELLVRALDIADLPHGMPRVLEILASFPGSYQMLPSPAIDLQDDHEKLYERASWGTLPVRAALLDKARRFHDLMREVIDPERLLYVAGFDGKFERKTPFRIRIDAPGDFAMQTTQDGDGRVPHVLGLLPDVATFWVDEVHGDLARNEHVLDAIDDLLQKGETDGLERTRPLRRGAAPEAKWVPAARIDPEPDVLERVRLRARAGEVAVAPSLTPEEQLEIEDSIGRDYLGTSARAAARKGAEAGARRGGRPPAARGAKIAIAVEVVWGDITRVEGDVYAVGHYQGVLPQRAELALDRVVSHSADELVITEHTRRGTLSAGLGDVSFFPWGERQHRSRTVAVAGMGRPGSFGLPALRRLTRDLVLSISLLPNVKTVCSVLIGSGEGTLAIGDAVRGMLEGIVEALASGRAGSAPIRKLRIVERERDRAQDILDALLALGATSRAAGPLRLRIASELKRGEGGAISDEVALRELLDVSSAAAKAPAESARRKAVESLVAKIPEAETRKRAAEALANLGSATRLTREIQQEHSFPTRISVIEERGVIRVAAITETATVAERPIEVDPKLIGEIVTETNDPDVEPMPTFATFLLRLVFPRDLREKLVEGSSVVFEVDRTSAPIHWEMMACDAEAAPDDEPLGVQSQVARQLRTSYSPPPSDARRREGALRALVVGDPGDPKIGDNLPGARDEAIEVCRILRAQGADVTALIGAPNVARRNLPRDSKPATRIEVLNQLMHGRWDILHYCGHGDFDPDDPRRAGWVFAGGLLTAREIERLDEVPALIVANACLSSRTSQALAGGDRVEFARRESGLLPSLADEFFHLGVRNYVGTSWEVNDLGAVDFARALYGELLGKQSSIGAAVLTARKALWARRRNYGKLWAAYQHYGDPTSKL